MAYDAGMLSCVLREINETLEGGRVDKIYQPSHDEVVLLIRARGGDYRLFINAGGSGARLNLTGEKPENPSVPPMFCMMLRKHFTGARFRYAKQLGFERAARLIFDTYDEMGFAAPKHMICEVMGRFSNLIITNAEDKILGVLKSVDFTTSEKRQVLAGMTYELPPKQDKRDPMDETLDVRQFRQLAASCEGSKPASQFILSHFSGIAPVIAREIAYRAGGRTDATLEECARDLASCFFEVIGLIKSGTGSPFMVRNEANVPVEYAYLPLHQYGPPLKTEKYGSFGELIDAYFEEKSREERLHRRASDIFRLLTNAESRVTKKISVQREELAACEEGERYKLWGDLITANIYRLKKGMESASLENYWSEAMEPVLIPLDQRLTPAQNAQRYYKKYNKSKTAKVHLTEQLSLAEAELTYLYTVLDALSRAETERELSEIREELYHSGYASRMKNYTEKKPGQPLIARYETTDGHTVLCGRNNIANDYLTTKLANRNDWWFHVKNQPGSHVVLVSGEGEEEPPEEAFTEAAMIAAYNSKAKGGVMVPVDYMKVRQVKKPAGAKPGFVVYYTNWSCYVTPEEKKVKAMARK